MDSPPTHRNPTQGLLLRLYAAARRAGLLETALGRLLFEQTYGLYKFWLEGADIKTLRPLIAPDTLVIDVGANAGVFTVQFARWVSGRGRVIAIEPEAANLARLRRALADARLEPCVEVVAAAATSEAGSAFLKINPDHPGDHRLGLEGQPIEATTLDVLVARHHWTPVSLIKIDVQGAEAAVLAGAEEVLRRFRPALYVEVDDRNLREFGSSAEALIGRLADFGYVPCRLASAKRIPLDMQALLAKARAAYVDVLFLKG
jgi:FkbM family methyltransferase